MVKDCQDELTEKLNRVLTVLNVASHEVVQLGVD